MGLASRQAAPLLTQHTSPVFGLLAILTLSSYRTSFIHSTFFFDFG